ncbi:MAG: TonB family protein [Leptolyngbyaceae cyanobacterium MO_188.B28]|nr:TonB family protein [Leptolyngbyaceae cyanobacterium MO_188.B28]
MALGVDLANLVQGYRSQHIAKQNDSLKFCFVGSIMGHFLLAGIAALWFQQPSSNPKSVAREPISFIVIDAPETAPPLDAPKRANINSAAGGQPMPDLPTNADQSSSTALLPLTPKAPYPTPYSQDASTGVISTEDARSKPRTEPHTEPRDTLESTQSQGQVSPWPNPVQSPEQAVSPQPTQRINQAETTPESFRPAPPILVGSSSPRVSSSPPPVVSRSMPQPQTAPPILDSTPETFNSTPQSGSRSANTVSTSAADLLGGGRSELLTAQGTPQLFNPNQTGSAQGVGAVRDDLWGAYLARVHQSIVGQWSRIQIDQTRQTRVLFTINSQGALVGSVRLTQSSGFRMADQSALQAVRAAAPFGAFPPGTDKPSLTISFTFNYTLR